MKAILIIFFLISTCNITFTFAKCPVESMPVSGKILNEDKEPIGDALICIFIDNKKNGFCSKSNSNGDYTVESLYDTYSGISFLKSDKCNNAPSLITTVVVLEGYWPIILKQNIKNSILDRGVLSEAIVINKK